ncbi:MAG: PilN domain-containing protein [Azonexus sp.]|jgi:type IV pilus assembly protein PilN|nr:PilN domain-containing protein [Azonexus sp.]
MIRINLLPHREMAKKARRQQFFVLIGLVAVLAALVVFAVYTVIDRAIENQTERNSFLKAKIDALDKELAEIKGLKEQTQALLERKQVIEDLQRDRGETVYLLSELVKQVPEGIYLKSLKQTGFNISVTGYAQSNARISAFMRNIDASPWLEQPRLIESKAVVLNGRRVNEFGMNFTQTRIQADDGKGKK